LLIFKRQLIENYDILEVNEIKINILFTFIL
jgi:hypothetical protein